MTTVSFSIGILGGSNFQAAGSVHIMAEPKGSSMMSSSSGGLIPSKVMKLMPSFALGLFGL
jgi:hypothetical protein